MHQFITFFQAIFIISYIIYTLLICFQHKSPLASWVLILPFNLLTLFFVGSELSNRFWDKYPAVNRLQEIGVDHGNLLLVFFLMLLFGVTWMSRNTSTALMKIALWIPIPVLLWIATVQAFSIL